MFEVDFLPVESESGPGSKSGDAIAVHWKDAAGAADFVVVVDAGFTEVGNDLAKHITKYYGTSHVDLVISTHPDADHINGIATLLDALSVVSCLSISRDSMIPTSLTFPTSKRWTSCLTLRARMASESLSRSRG